VAINTFDLQRRNLILSRFVDALSRFLEAQLTSLTLSLSAAMTFTGFADDDSVIVWNGDALFSHNLAAKSARAHQWNQTLQHTDIDSSTAVLAIGHDRLFVVAVGSKGNSVIARAVDVATGTRAAKCSCSPQCVR
jgi:hypothetical protein